MMRNYRLLSSQTSGRRSLETWVSGLALLGDPMLNRGTAFTTEERDELGLVGLLPSAVTTLDEQVKRSYAQYQQQADDFGKNIFFDRVAGPQRGLILPVALRAPRRDVTGGL